MTLITFVQVFVVYAILAILGLGLIIKNNIFIFNGLKILSIIFLIFIGIKSVLN